MKNILHKLLCSLRLHRWVFADKHHECTYHRCSKCGEYRLILPKIHNPYDKPYYLMCGVVALSVASFIIKWIVPLFA